MKRAFHPIEHREGSPSMVREHRCKLLVVCACFLLGQTAAALAVAGEQEPFPGEASRYFGGHLFIPSTIVPDPFISTTFTSITGFGQALNLKVPIQNLNGDKIGELSGNIGFMMLEFDFQQAIGHRFDVRVGGTANARVGTSAQSILAEGISALYGYQLGGTASVLKKRNWQLSATVDLRSNTLYSISPIDFVRSVVNSIQAGDTTGAVGSGEDSLLSSGNNLRALGGVRAAYTPAPWIGFTGFVESGLGEPFEEGRKNTSVVNFGGSLSFDLNPLKRIPIGLLGTFRRESLSEKGEDFGGSAVATGFGIFYTGRRFFSMGIENTWQRVDQPNSDEAINAVMARIVLRYDFR